MTPRPNQPQANLQNLQIPQPTPQEINNLREKHPQLASLTDDIIQGMVMKHRTQEIMRRRQEQIQQQMLQRRQAAQNPGQTLGIQMGQPQQPAPPAQRPQPQQTPKMSAPAKSQPTATPQMPAKGIKRPSSDDVFEVPNPNVNQQRPQTKPPPKAPAANMGQIPQKPTEVQKNQSQATQREKSNAPPPQAPTQNQPKTAEMIKSEERYKSILNEVRQATPQRQPVPMDADTRRKMLEKLASARELITRMGPFLSVFYKVFNDENGLRNLSRVYLTLAQQYRNEQVKLASPVEHFTIGLEELESNITTLHGYFNTTMDRMNRQKALTQKVAEQTKESTPALSAANLQQHQNNMKLQHQNNMKKENNRAPPAPTSAQPRNPWGPYSPQGVAAVCDGPNQLTQDKLQLPALKKIKHNTSAENTPAHIQGTPIPAASPLITKSPEIQKTPAPVMLRCPVPNCSETRGFATQTDLDKHMLEHETKEPSIDDPLKFALEQMQLALNLDKNGKAKPKAEVDTAEAPKMKQSASSQGIKQESATPMSRVPTGPSPASKSKTPQQPKTPAPSSSVLPDVILPDDPWATSRIRPDVIQEAFTPLSTLQGPRTWTKIQDYLTPESSSDNTDPSNPSPRLSDVSEHDAVKISMDVSQNPSLSKNWIPVDWMDPDLRAGMDDFELLDLNVEPGAHEPFDMDWEALFNETDEEARARADRDRARVEKDLERGGTGVTEEFGRIYGFGEIEPEKR